MPSQYLVGGAAPYEQGSLALSNLVAGNAQAAAQSAYDPDALTPEQRQSLAARLGLQDSALGSLVNIAADPVVLAGLAMTVAFRRKGPLDKMLFRGVFEKPKVRPGLITKILPGMERLRGTSIPYDIEMATKQGLDAVMPHIRRINEIEAAFIKKHGRGLSAEEKQQVRTVLDDTFGWEPDDPTKKRQHSPNVWRNMIGILRDWSKRNKDGELSKRAKPFYDDFTDRTGRTPEEAAALMEGELAAYAARTGSRTDRLNALTPDLRKVHDDMRDLLNKMYDENFNPELAPIVSEYMGVIWARKGKPLSDNDLKFVRQYFHRPEKALPEEEQALFAERIRRRVPVESVTEKAVGAAKGRRFLTPPDPETVKAAGFSDEFINVMTALAPQRGGRSLFYSTDMDDVWRRYMRSIQVARGWHVPPVDELAKQTKTPIIDKIRDTVGKLRGEGGVQGAIEADYVENVLVPQSMGGLTLAQQKSAREWLATKQWMVEKVDFLKSKFGDPGGVLSKLKDWAVRDPSSTWQGVGHSISQHLFASTLGAPNFLGMAVNSLQPIIGSGLSLGELPGAWKHAFKDVRGIMKYAAPKNLGGEGLDIYDAVKKGAPEFAETFTVLSHASGGEFANNFNQGLMRSLAGQTVTTWTRKVRDYSMVPFMGTEFFNKLTTFHGHRLRFRDMMRGKDFPFRVSGKTRTLETFKEGPLLNRAAREYADDMVQQTMFGSGPLHTPSGVQEWWSPARQFLTFPARQAGLMARNVLTDPHATGQMLLASGLLYEGSKEFLGADTSRALAFGGLPAPTEGSVFAPLPVVPPFVQLIGSAGMSLATGDPEELLRSAPLLVPGGVGLARMAGAIPGAAPVSAAIGRKFADYERRAPDGRIPVYTDEGSLVGYYTDMQLWGQSLGFAMEGPQQEAGLTKWLLSQRDRMRQTKHDYLEAMFQNDVTSMKHLAAEYEKKYPGLGGIPVRPEDVRALHLRHDVSRIERILETVPPEHRADLTGVVSAGLGAGYPEILGLQMPGLEAGSTINLREPYRVNPRQTAEDRVRNSMHGVSLREKIRGDAHEATKRGSSELYPTGQNYTQGGPYAE